MDKMPMSRKSIKLLLACLIVMVAGYLLLSGGGVNYPDVFNYAMFDFRRLVAAPVVMVAGIVVIVVAIMRKPKEGEE